MYQRSKTTKLLTLLFALLLLISSFSLGKAEVNAINFPSISVSFNPTDESVIVEGVCGFSPDGNTYYMLEGYLKFETKR